MKKVLIVLFALSYLFLCASYTQETQKKTQHNEIFNLIERGIKGSDISEFSVFFGKQIYLNLKSGENGLFSANQAYYILQNYLSNRKIIDFNFNSFGYADDIPFAVGNLVFKYKNNHIFAQVYVSLVSTEGKWVIDKINIY